MRSPRRASYRDSTWLSTTSISLITAIVAVGGRSSDFERSARPLLFPARSSGLGVRIRTTGTEAIVFSGRSTSDDLRAGRACGPSNEEHLELALALDLDFPAWLDREGRDVGAQPIERRPADLERSDEPVALHPTCRVDRVAPEVPGEPPSP